MDDDSHAGEESEGTLVRRIAPDSETAEYEVLEIIADLEGTDIEELPSLYTVVDHLVERLYRTPPSNKAQVSISFSYAGYRITLRQSGHAEVVQVKDSLGDP